MVEYHRVQPDQYPGLKSNPIITVGLADAEQTRRLGSWIAQRIEAGAFVGLIGALGAGKTTLMQGLVAGLDTMGGWTATSPTYSLVQVYETTPPIHHIDLYRLEGWADLESIGYWDYLEGERGVTCVEWLDRIVGAWPGQGMIIELIRKDASRNVRIWSDERWAPVLKTFDAAELHGSESNEESR